MDTNKHISNWLFFSCFMVVAMAVIGAITRLTESGLSMVEWRPLIGALPPLSDTEWQRVFDLYRLTPEYHQVNAGMTIQDFKMIFFWEWFHRLWGRLIGLVYALPLIFFWIRGMIPQGFKGKLLFGLVLGALQAVMGWYMVASGLVDRPDVSHYRLAAHLGLAFIIFGYLLWLGLDIRGLKPAGRYSFCKLRHGTISLSLLILTVIWGAFTAGLEAGLVYNTWPLMGGQITPPETLASITENHAWVQFTHRWIAALALISILSFAWRIKALWLSAAVMAQFVLGIFTLISQLWIPLAALHQFGALIVFGLMIYHLNGLWRSRR